MPVLAGRRLAPVHARSTRRQMALVGLVGIVLDLVTVQTALSGLQHVDSAHEDVGRISRAERYFQDADQAHDALHADVLQALLDSGPNRLEWVGATDETDFDAAAFRSNLELVDGVQLAPDLARAMRVLRPGELEYVSFAVRIDDMTHTDPIAARLLLPAFTRTFLRLQAAQAEVTARLDDQAHTVQLRANHEERRARWRIVLASIVALIGMAFLTVVLMRLGRALAAMAARQRGVAEQLQHSLLPEALPDLPGIELAARYVPGGVGTEVGGDWYDVIPLRSGAIGVVMGDVAGHDLRAAAVMGQMRNALRAYITDGRSPGEALERLNSLSGSQTPGEMATCVYAILDPAGGTLDVANAGHLPPLVAGPQGQVRTLTQVPEPPIGAVRNVAYSTVSHKLLAGDTLLMFTDGLIERRGQSLDEGLDRLMTIMGRPIRTPQQLCDTLVAELLGEGPPDDDVAVLAVRPAAELGPHLALRWPAEPSCLVMMRRALERWLTEAGADEVECYEVVVACSEAATNAIEHAYGPGVGDLEVVFDIDHLTGEVLLVVRDEGRWRPARGRDRGRGLNLVHGLMDDVQLVRAEDGTEVRMRRRLRVPAPHSPRHERMKV